MIIQKIIQGSFLENIQSISKNSLVLTLKTKERIKVFLLLDFLNQRRPFLISKKENVDLKPNSFLQISRKYLRGKRLHFFYENKEGNLFFLEFFSSLDSSEPNILSLSLRSNQNRLSLLRRHKSLPDNYKDRIDMKALKGDVFESCAEWSTEGFRTRKSLFLKTDEFFTCLIYKSSYVQNESILDDSSSEIKIPSLARKKIFRYLKFLKKRIQRQKEDLPSLEFLSNEENKLLKLQSNLHLWPKDSPRWIVSPILQNTYDLEKEYSLESRLSPGEYLELRFKKLKKLKRRFSLLSIRLKESQDIYRKFQKQLEELQSEEDSTEFDLKLKSLLKEHKLKASQGESSANNRLSKSSKNNLFYEHCTELGEFLRVSKNAEKADHMLKLIPGNHFWFHAYHIPGSHVWLEKKGRELKEHSLKEAAILALYYSKSSRSFSGEVQFTQRMHVKKNNKLSPGKVLVNKYKTIYVKFTEEELKSILSRTHDA